MLKLIVRTIDNGVWGGTGEVIAAITDVARSGSPDRCSGVNLTIVVLLRRVSQLSQKHLGEGCECEQIR